METGAGARDQAEAAREEIAELTALLDGYDKAVEEVRITRKTLPDHPGLPADHGRVLHGRLPAPRAVCEAMDLEIAPKQQQQCPPQVQAAG
ncbi:hypothetical protein [Streptomyces sp. NPDC002853]